MQNCETYKAKSYKYSAFYELWSIEDTTSDDYFLDLKLFALAHKDVFLLLSPTSNITNETLLLEFGKY